MSVLAKLRWRALSLLRPDPKESNEPDALRFRCNICGRINDVSVSKLERENHSCFCCRSSVRCRAIISLLSRELFGKSLPLADFPVRKDLTGAGMSDWFGYAEPLAKKLNYTNTFYHKKPRLDITRIDPSREGTLDFLISSDVFEHVAPPVSRAFSNAAALLKPNGIFILTVPFVPTGPTREHFPELHDYQLIRDGKRYILKNITRDGQEQIFEDLVFHGGSGMTLQMREFSRESLIEYLKSGGFHSITIHDEPDLEHGVHWKYDWSLPITARR